LGGPEFLQQAIKFQLFIYRLQQRGIGRLGLERLDLDLDRHARVDGRQALAHAYALGIVLQALAMRLALYLGRALESRINAAETLDQVLRAFLANPWRARNVVDGIALQREQVRDLRGLDAQKCLD